MPPNIDTYNVWSDSGMSESESERARERERENARKKACVKEKRLIGRTCEEEMKECECVGWHTKKKSE